jgi:iron complex outermembrane receptor protein
MHRTPNNRRTLGGLALALLSTAAFSGSALAQAVATDDNLETVVVTGTSIRGVNPVGSNLISVTRADLDKTNVQSMQQIYKTIPALSNMGALPQGNTSGNAYYAPTIHNLGSSSSNSTLVLIDGHRFSLGSQQQPLSDPGIVPAIAIQRVEVLADGASSVYGSDAVAGVVNFVTRKNFEGFQVDGQAGFADGYHTLESGILWGERWSDASLMLAANYSYRSILKSNARDSLNPDHSAHWGGTNFNNTQCEPAQIQVNGAGNYYPNAQTATAVPLAQAQRCNSNAYSALAPSDMRLNGMVKFQKSIGDRLTLGIDTVYSDRIDKRPVSRGGLNGVTVFGAGPQANPFYTNPPGQTATKQTIYYNADTLLGPGAYSLDDAKDMYIDTTFDYNINDNWHATFLALYGSEDNNVASYGTINSSAANLALNGTTNSSGSTTIVSVPGTTQLVTQLPLTTANALDVWHPAGSGNLTSQAVKNAITDNGQTSVWYYSTQQYRAGVDGSPFSLPGGDVHVAAGGEYVHYTLDINKTSPNNTGPASTGSAYLHIPLKRTVRSAYAEVLLPIVSPEMGVPFANKISIDISGRYDDYSDVGETANPKYAVDWEVVPGFKLRGNYASSFVAPELSSIGDLSRGGQTSFTSYSGSSSQFLVDTRLFPSAIGIPGCSAVQAAANPICTIPTSTRGISFNGSPANPRPSNGKSWSLGFDVSPSLVPGLTWGLTYFNTRYINAITGTNMSNALSLPSLGLIQFFPAGLTSYDALTPYVPPYATAGTVNFPVYYALSTRQNNVLNLGIGGIDSTINYHFDTDNDGGFDVGADISSFLLFRQHLKGGPSFSVLGSTGANNTFGSVPVQARFHLGWDFDGFGVTTFVRYISGYHNYTSSGAAGTPTDPATGLPAVSLASVVNPSATVDLHLTYTFSNESLWGQQLAGSEVFVDAENLLDHSPSFYNSSTGYDGYTGNPIGRLVSFGFRVRM